MSERDHYPATPMPDTESWIRRDDVLAAVRTSPHRRRAHAEHFVHDEQHLLYAFWRVPRSRDGFLVRELDGELRVFRLKEPHPTSRAARAGICTICCSHRPPGATALWTATINKRTTLGDWICFDFDCARRSFGLLPPEAGAIRETLTPWNRLDRTEANLDRFLNRLVVAAA